MKPIGLTVIATGARAQVVVSNLLRDAKGGVKVVSVHDPSGDALEAALSQWQTSDARRAASAEEAITDPDATWVMVFSPNAFHKDHILKSFKAQKHVFAEKPLATTINDCQAIYEAHTETDLHFATGFVLRYSPLYRKAKELLQSGALGTILSISASENITPDHGGYIMRNWRRSRALAGPHILEKCCHDLDLINWYCESLPETIAAFASNDFFVPVNESLTEKFPPQTFTLWPDPSAKGSPFTSDKDIADTHVAILQYRNGIKVSFQSTMSNALPERRMYFSCTEGTMVLEAYAGTLTWKRIGELEPTHLQFPAGLHGGGDDHIMKALFETMTLGAAPTCSGSEGLESAVTALAIDEAACRQKQVDLAPIWKKLGR